MKSKLDKVNRKSMAGAAVIEFAILLTLLLTIAAGVVEFGRTIWYYDALTKATRDGARFLSKASVSEIGNLAVAESEPSVEECAEMTDMTADRIVYCAARAANVPGLVIDNVEVLCDSGKCSDGMTAPDHVTVRIINYTIRIGEWIPFFAGIDPQRWNVAPQLGTTMRYMR